MTYFDNFGVEHASKEIKNIIGNRNITANISRLESYNSVMCSCFCTGFIDFTLQGENLLEYFIFS